MDVAGIIPQLVGLKHQPIPRLIVVAGAFYFGNEGVIPRTAAEECLRIAQRIFGGHFLPRLEVALQGFLFHGRTLTGIAEGELHRVGNVGFIQLRQLFRVQHPVDFGIFLRGDGIAVIPQHPGALLEAYGINARGRFVRDAQRRDQHFGKQQGAGHAAAQRRCQREPGLSLRPHGQQQHARGKHHIQPVGANQTAEQSPDKQARQRTPGRGFPLLPSGQHLHHIQGKQQQKRGVEGILADGLGISAEKRGQAEKGQCRQPEPPGQAPSTQQRKGPGKRIAQGQRLQQHIQGRTQIIAVKQPSEAQQHSVQARQKDGVPGIDLPQAEILRRHFPQIPAHGAGEEGDQERRPAHQQHRHGAPYRMTLIPARLRPGFFYRRRYRLEQRNAVFLHPVVKPCKPGQHGQRLPQRLQAYQPQRQRAFQRRPAVVAVQPHAEGVHHAEEQGERRVRRGGTQLSLMIDGVIQQRKAQRQRAPQVAGAAGGRIADALIVFSADDKAHGAQRAERGAEGGVPKAAPRFLPRGGHGCCHRGFLRRWPLSRFRLISNS